MQALTVSVGGETVGTVRERATWWNPVYHVFDSVGNQVTWGLSDMVEVHLAVGATIEQTKKDPVPSLPRYSRSGAPPAISPSVMTSSSAPSTRRTRR